MAVVFGGGNLRAPSASSNSFASGDSSGAASDPSADTTANGGATGGWGSALGPALSAAASLYGSQNAAEAVTKGNTAGIATQRDVMGNISSLYGAQSTLGNQSFGALGSALGVNGAPPDYSGFLNMPGYQFAVQQGTQAINRNAAASGNLFSTSTLADVGKQVTGTAMQDYNNYISQLMQAGGFGASANQNLSGAQLRTGGNISQMQTNSGVAQAGGYTSAGGALGQLPWGAIGKGIGNIFGPSANSSGVDPSYGGDPNAPNNAPNMNVPEGSQNPGDPGYQDPGDPGNP